MGINDRNMVHEEKRIQQWEDVSIRRLQQTAQSLRQMTSVGGGVKRQVQRFMHAWTHIHALISTPDETSSLWGTDITYKKPPQPNNRGSIFGGVTGLKEFDYS